MDEKKKKKKKTLGFEYILKGSIKRIYIFSE